jgi:hypothetical protein
MDFIALDFQVCFANIPANVRINHADVHFAVRTKSFRLPVTLTRRLHSDQDSELPTAISRWTSEWS